MACSHPLYAYQEAPGEKPIILAGDYLGQKIYFDRYGNAREIIQLPCGHCVQCRLQYSRNWADRCMLEAQKYEYNEFLTLTYDPEDLPKGQKIDLETGELYGESNPLVPEHLTKFIKKLRQAFARGQYRVTHDDGASELIKFPVNKNIRFYYCGEYGTKNQRPHYHLIIFNLNVPDKKFLFTNGSGSLNYTSDLIKSIWNKGLISLCPVTWETCAYTARYVMKKQKGPQSAEYYASQGLVPEFVRMSRKPGIGREYFDENRDSIYKYDAIYLKKGDKIEKVRPCRYYDKLFDIHEHEFLQKLKERRKAMAEIITQSKLSQTSMSEREFLALNEELTLERIKQLKRNFENGE